MTLVQDHSLDLINSFFGNYYSCWEQFDCPRLFFFSFWKNVIELATPETLCPELGRENDEGNVEFKWKLVQPSLERLCHLVTQMKYRLAEGKGECVYQIGVGSQKFSFPELRFSSLCSLTDFELAASVQTIHLLAKQLNAKVDIMKISQGTEGKCTELLVSQCDVENIDDLRVCCLDFVILTQFFFC